MAHAQQRQAGQEPEANQDWRVAEWSGRQRHNRLIKDPGQRQGGKRGEDEMKQEVELRAALCGVADKETEIGGPRHDELQRESQAYRRGNLRDALHKDR